MRQFPAREENPPLAGETFQPDISAQTVDLPLISPAGMNLSHLHHIADLEIREHERIITHDIMPKWSQCEPGAAKV